MHIVSIDTYGLKTQLRPSPNRVLVVLLQIGAKDFTLADDQIRTIMTILQGTSTEYGDCRPWWTLLVAFVNMDKATSAESLLGFRYKSPNWSLMVPPQFAQSAITLTVCYTSQIGAGSRSR